MQMMRSIDDCKYRTHAVSKVLRTYAGFYTKWQTHVILTRPIIIIITGFAKGYANASVFLIFALSHFIILYFGEKTNNKTWCSFHFAK